MIDIPEAPVVVYSSKAIFGSDICLDCQEQASIDSSSCWKTLKTDPSDVNVI